VRAEYTALTVSGVEIGFHLGTREADPPLEGGSGLAMIWPGVGLARLRIDGLTERPFRQLPRPLRELDFADSFMGWDAAILSG